MWNDFIFVQKEQIKVNVLVLHFNQQQHYFEVNRSFLKYANQSVSNVLHCQWESEYWQNTKENGDAAADQRDVHQCLLVSFAQFILKISQNNELAKLNYRSWCNIDRTKVEQGRKFRAKNAFFSSFSLFCLAEGLSLWFTSGQKKDKKENGRQTDWLLSDWFNEWLSDWPTDSLRDWCINRLKNDWPFYHAAELLNDRLAESLYKIVSLVSVLM